MVSMSRIGKNPIIIPEGVDVSFKDGFLFVKGPRGELKRKFRDEIIFEKKDDSLKLKMKKSTLQSRALWGTYASHIKNMIKGVVEGFAKKLIIEGVGYRVELRDKKLIVLAGYSHPVAMDTPEGISFVLEKNSIKIEGIDKELVGETAARIRAIRKPEPYKGKGIRYENEIIRRKAGKKAVGSS
ncbi:MAG: 50S ribosomal protein L6 [Parcubacteria group bacterium GW2011_GWB1_41_6]|nr:MAG: 50S ribosomal protein L6 [Parcubacteria group bacterium GW2011_GWB1_41_6]KKS34648.1 MAG: 50S ribosomal protein L6 [Parcubacteria group bacterium GW2011_GWC2_42_13]KKS58047.1 MAG: 50S ribosomal protein L6 [Parcubacteria group bacterium GW2011_GWA2_42_35]